MIGPAQAVKSYLNVDPIAQAIKDGGADATGYGSLSENPRFSPRSSGRASSSSDPMLVGILDPPLGAGHNRHAYDDCQAFVGNSVW